MDIGALVQSVGIPLACVFLTIQLLGRNGRNNGIVHRLLDIQQAHVNALWEIRDTLAKIVLLLERKGD